MKLLKKFLDTSRKEALRKMAHGVTDVGRERHMNEDYFLINREKNLYIVADGMGGHNAGDVASQNAVKLADAYMTNKILDQISSDNRKVRDTIIKSLLHAHMKVLDMADKNPDFEGMGCTIVTALLFNNCLHLCHVGDARAYLVNDSGIKLLTRDHSYVMELVKKGRLTIEEARVSPMKNKLNQAIGASKSINPDYKHCELMNGDKILLCSDGLWDMLTDEQIFTVMVQDKPVKKICETLVKMANDAGGHDNITAVIIQYNDANLGTSAALNVDAQELEKTGEYSFVLNNRSPGGNIDTKVEITRDIMTKKKESYVHDDTTEPIFSSEELRKISTGEHSGSLKKEVRKELLKKDPPDVLI